jgi:hypothetical protein
MPGVAAGEITDATRAGAFDRDGMSSTISRSPQWETVSRVDVLRSIDEYDRLGADGFFAKHGFAPTRTYELLWDGRSYPPKAILGAAHELATGRRLAPSDFEGGKAGAVRVLRKLGFTVRERASND